MIDIGMEIKKELKRQGHTVSWLARKLFCERSNIYSIFKRRSINTEMLLLISKALHHNFFSQYNEEAGKSHSK